MADCHRIADRLAEFVDGALPAQEHADVERHLQQCPPCRDAAAAEEAGRRLVRECAARLRQEAVPSELRSRCEEIARRQCAFRGGRWRQRLIPVAIGVAAGGLAAAGVVAVLTRRSARFLAAQLTLHHLRCFGRLSVEAAAVDPEAVEAVLSTAYGWDGHVPPSSEADALRLVGARQCRYVDGRIPHLMYRVDSHDVSLYILEGVRRDEAEVVVLGYRTRIWSNGSTTYALVSGATGANLERAASFIRQEVH